MTTHKQRGLITWAISLLAVGFGVLTIKSGGAVLFGDEAAQASGGNFVPFVLWFNFIAGFAYIIAGVGLWMQQRWSAWLAIGIALATAVTFAAFGAYIYSGGIHEQRTVIAMIIRTLVWLTIAAISWRQLLKRSK